MSLRLYLDVHTPLAITEALRRQGVDVLTAQEDGSRRFLDPALLDRALALNRVLFTRDEDFLGEGSRRQQAGEAFAGIIYAHQIRVTIGQCGAIWSWWRKFWSPGISSAASSTCL